MRRRRTPCRSLPSPSCGSDGRPGSTSRGDALSSLFFQPCLPRWSRLLIAVLLLGSGFIAVDRASRGSNDFDGFHAGARSVWEHGVLSEEKAVSRYPPLFQVLMAPLGALPVGLAALLWFLASVAALLALPGELERVSGVPAERQLAAFAILAPFIVDDLMLGQSGLLLLWAATHAVARARQGGGGLAAGFVLGLCAGLKLLPVMLLAVPALLGRWRRTVAGVLLFAVLASGVSVVVLGGDAVLEGLSRWQQENTSKQTPWALVQWGRSMRFNNQALATVLARSFADIGTREARSAVQVTSFPLTTIWWIYGALVLAIAWRGLAAAVAAARLVRRPDASVCERDLAWGGLYALSALTLLLAAPLVWTHYFLWALPAFVIAPLGRRAKAVVGGAFALGLASESLRALGLQLWICLGLFVLLSGQLLRVGRSARYPGERPTSEPCPASAGSLETRVPGP